MAGGLLSPDSSPELQVEFVACGLTRMFVVLQTLCSTSEGPSLTMHVAPAVGTITESCPGVFVSSPTVKGYKMSSWETIHIRGCRVYVVWPGNY